LWTRAIQAAAPTVDYARFDTNRNGEVSTSELSLLLINASPVPDGNGTTLVEPMCVPTTGPSGSVRVCIELSSVAQDTSFITMTHEIAHSFGAYDLYNSSGQAAGATLMNNIVASSAARASVELDAWHKIALGWVTPRVYDIAQPGSCEFMQISLADEFFDAATYYERPILLYDSRRGGNEFFLLEARLRDSWFNRYDADAAGTGLFIWYVQQDASRQPALIPGLKIEAGANNTLDSTPAPGSDDNVSGGALWSGNDDIWQSTKIGDDAYYYDRAVLQLPVGAPRGITDVHTPDEGRFRARYLAPWDDAELAIETASIGNPQWLAVRWGHHALDVLPRVGNSELFQYCHDRFPH
jgi:M6 family metalloprotease-like protein